MKSLAIDAWVAYVSALPQYGIIKGGLKSAHFKEQKGGRLYDVYVQAYFTPLGEFRYTADAVALDAEYLKAIEIGCLDVLLTRHAYPVLGLEVKVQMTSTDRSGMSEYAFRRAGQMLAGQLLDEPNLQLTVVRNS